jgi:hypothetical protein
VDEEIREPGRNRVAPVAATLEHENARLKHPVADLTLDRHILQEVIKKTLRPIRRRELATWIYERFRVSTVRACRLARLQRASWYYRSRPVINRRCAYVTVTYFESPVVVDNVTQQILTDE